MKTEYKYIKFTETLRTGNWKCLNKKNLDLLGSVFFYDTWKQFVFEFDVLGDFIFNSSCLRDVAHFLDQLNARKKERIIMKERKMQEFLDEIDDYGMKALAGLYLPVISRWAAAEGWDVVRQWLYVLSISGMEDHWYRILLLKMTVEEHRTEDKRRLAVVGAMASDNARRLIAERAFLQKFITGLITRLISKI